MKNRKIEFFSFVATMMVVVIHVKGTDVCGMDRFVQSLLKSVASIAVPFFFCVSGYMLAKHVSEDGWWRDAVRKRLKTIVVPYLCWNVIAFVVLSAQRLGSNILHHTELSRNIDSLWVVLGVDLMQSPEDGPLWYLRTLMLFVVICPPLVWLVRKSRLSGVLTIVFVFLLGNVLDCCFVKPSSFHGFVNFFLAPSCLVYFLAGCFLRTWSVAVNRGWFYVSAVLGFSCMVASSACGGYGIGMPKVLRIATFNFQNAMLLAGVWGIMPERKLPQFLVGLAMPIYVEHVIVLGVLGNLVHPFVRTTVSQTTVGLLVQVLVCVCVCVALTKLLKRKWPRLAGVVFGGR